MRKTEKIKCKKNESYYRLLKSVLAWLFIGGLCFGIYSTYRLRFLFAPSNVEFSLLSNAEKFSSIGKVAILCFSPSVATIVLYILFVVIPQFLMTEEDRQTIKDKEEVEIMENLTAAQLIEGLEKMPQDALVSVSGEDTSFGICQIIQCDDVVDLVLNEEL